MLVLASILTFDLRVYFTGLYPPAVLNFKLNDYFLLIIFTQMLMVVGWEVMHLLDIS